MQRFNARYINDERVDCDIAESFNVIMATGGQAIAIALDDTWERVKKALDATEAAKMGEHLILGE